MNYFRKQSWLDQSINTMLNEVQRVWDKYKPADAADVQENTQTPALVNKSIVARLYDEEMDVRFFRKVY